MSPRKAAHRGLEPRRRRAPFDARRLMRLYRPDLARLDQADENVPLILFQDGGVLRFPDPDGIALDDDLRAGRARGAEGHRDFLHGVSPPFASMWAQTAAWRCPFMA